MKPFTKNYRWIGIEYLGQNSEFQIRYKVRYPSKSFTRVRVLNSIQRRIEKFKPDIAPDTHQKLFKKNEENGIWGHIVKTM